MLGECPGLIARGELVAGEQAVSDIARMMIESVIDLKIIFSRSMTFDDFFRIFQPFLQVIRMMLVVFNEYLDERCDGSHLAPWKFERLVETVIRQVKKCLDGCPAGGVKCIP